MSYTETVKESGKFRAVIINDDSPSRPDWDGQSAVLSLFTKYYSNDVEAMNDAAGQHRFEEALRTFSEAYRGSKALRTFERYLRIFHGTRGFAVHEADGRETDFTYVAFDTAELREVWGTTDEYLDSLDEKERNACLAKSTLDEWVAWASGDVWGVRVERSTGYVKTWEDGSVEDGREWVTVEDTEVWGHYGHDYAEETAISAMESEIAREN